MSNRSDIRWGWLKFMYWYTIVGAGGFGIAIIVMPETIVSIFGGPTQEPIMYGVIGSVYLAFGILSVLGLRSPLKFAPILLLQLFYKSVWFIGVIIPMIVSGDFPSYGIMNVIIFATYVIGDIIAIPFSYVFEKQPGQMVNMQASNEI